METIIEHKVTRIQFVDWRVSLFIGLTFLGNLVVHTMRSDSTLIVNCIVIGSVFGWFLAAYQNWRSQRVERQGGVLYLSQNVQNHIQNRPVIYSSNIFRTSVKNHYKIVHTDKRLNDLLLEHREVLPEVIRVALMFGLDFEFALEINLETDLPLQSFS